MPAATMRDAAETGVGFIDHGLLVNPLEYLMADHLRQRSLCCRLDRLAGCLEADLSLAEAIADYLSGDMAAHVLDEEEDLFPLLRRRAKADDEVERVLGLLAREHAEDDRSAHAIVASLREAIAAGTRTLDEDLKAALRSFAQRQRRHLAVENAIIMPLAEARLTPKDREGLARRMAVRRGIHPRPGAHP